MNTTSPRSSLAKLGLYPRPKPLKVMVLGQAGVGKTALVVRFVTRRFIGEYDPTLEKVYAFHTLFDNDMVHFDILDTAAHSDEGECLALEANIRWAEAFILMYSVTDKCSFDECNRLKFLINYNKRRRSRLGSNPNKESSALEVPVVLVGNKTDQSEDRMVSTEEGMRRSKEISCVCFHEISVRENVDQVWSVFHDVCRFWRLHSKLPRLKRSGSDSPASIVPFAGQPYQDLSSPDSTGSQGKTVTPVESSRSIISPVLLIGRRYAEVELEEEEVASEAEGGGRGSSGRNDSEPFRGRACTDGQLMSRRTTAAMTSRVATLNSVLSPQRPQARRMSISMRGNTSSC